MDIYEFDDGTVVSVRPNPTSGMVEVSMDGLTESLTLEVIDLGGRILHFEEIAPGHQPQSMKLDLTAEPNGVYIIRLSSQGKSLSQKLIKR